MLKIIKIIISFVVVLLTRINDIYMIREFRVKNYLSIRDMQELSFVAKNGSSELVAEVSEGVFLYKLGILYGSNASGKSNMLIALNEVFRLLVQPKSDAAQEIEGFHPFVLTKDEPTQMFVSFYVGGIRYDYNVAFNNKYILNETLWYYPNKSKSLFYERSFVGDNLQADIKFGSSLKLLVRTQDSIRENTLNNHSVLSVCRKIAFTDDIAPFNTLHNWIMENYHDVDGDGELIETWVEVTDSTITTAGSYKIIITVTDTAKVNEFLANMNIDDSNIKTNASGEKYIEWEFLFSVSSQA